MEMSTKPLPAGERGGIAALQIDDHLSRPILERGVFGEAGAGLGVEVLEIAELAAVCADVVQVRHQAAEASAPVADMVLADYRGAERLQNARHGIADDGAAQVVYLHLLGKIGVRIVHHHAAAGLRGVDRVAGDGRQEVVCQSDADEPRAGDLAVRCDAVELRGVDHPLRQFARFRAGAFRRRHGAVRLVVAELRPRRRPDHGRRVARTGGGERRLQALRQQLLQIHAGATSSACQPRCRSTATKLTVWPSSSSGRSPPSRRMERWWTKMSSPLSRTMKP